MSNKLNFEVVAMRRIGPKPDGTPRRNSLELNVVVDGAAHVIRVRRETGVLKFSDGLAEHPDLEEIKKRVLQHTLETIMKPAQERRLELRAAHRLP